jgi:hypothetical protein
MGRPFDFAAGLGKWKGEGDGQRVRLHWYGSVKGLWRLNFELWQSALVSGAFYV